MNIRTRALPLGILSVATALVLSGCSGIVPMQSAADSNNPECANVTVRLPDVVADLAQRETNAQATGAWGTPAAILLTCGVEVPGPSTLPCVSINEVDWLEDDSQAPLYRYTSYGRTPAVEVIIDSEAVSGTTTLVDLGAAVSVLPKTGKCTDFADVFSG
jgi:uncharacterized protein YceK